jgi:hypothetical protein
MPRGTFGALAFAVFLASQSGAELGKPDTRFQGARSTESVLTSQDDRIHALGDRPNVQPRDKLTLGDLMRPEDRIDAPVDNSYFTPLGAWSSAGHSFEGTLVVSEFPMSSSGAASDSTDPQEYFPGFAVDFFLHGNILVPTSREVPHALGENSYWRVLLSPGTVWSEADDDGMSRASFPFTLVATAFNEAHNGLATFVYDETRVSSLFLQVVQETAPWNKTDFWGSTNPGYTPRPLQAKGDLVRHFAEEERLQVPILPFTTLGEHVDPALLAAYNGGIEPEEISATGLVWNGTLFLQPCRTRYGDYPYPRYMRHGAFSLTKAMGACVALLRLAQKYGDDVFALEITDYVSIPAAHDGWESVTFADALNMATGVGDQTPRRVEPNVMQGDEDQSKFFSFMRARSKREKLEIVASYGDYPWGPGEVARYNSINTFALSAAMDAFLKSREGEDADIWEMVCREVYRPIGILHPPIMRTLEPDGSKGLPIFGYGLYPNVDDVAKLSMLLQNQGRHQGQQILHAGRLAEAMFLTSAIGLPTGESSERGVVTYHLAFNGLPYRGKGGKEGRLHRIPVSTGYGGNHWVLLPNGVTTFRFADGNRYGVGSMVDVAAAIRPF